MSFNARKNSRIGVLALKAGSARLRDFFVILWTVREIFLPELEKTDDFINSQLESCNRLILI